MNESQSNSFLAEQPVGALMRKFSLPCILSLLVGALYNIVDQLFIANASYLGSYGNAANSVVFPLTVIALAIATMIGDGCCAYVSIRLGAGEGAAAKNSSLPAYWIVYGHRNYFRSFHLLRESLSGVELSRSGNRRCWSRFSRI